MESTPSQDPAALAVQVQSLTAMVEELTRQNQEMRQQLQQEQNHLVDSGNAQPLESCHFYVLPKGKIPNRTGGWRNQRRPGLKKRVLSSSPSLEGEPYLDD